MNECNKSGAVDQIVWKWFCGELHVTQSFETEQITKESGERKLATNNGLIPMCSERLPSPSAKNHILNTWCTNWATCHFTFPSRHSDSTETVLRRPCRLKAGDIIILGTTTSSFYCYSIVIFPSCPFLDMWNTWSLSPSQAQTWGKTGKILMMMKRKKIPKTLFEHSDFDK